MCINIAVILAVGQMKHSMYSVSQAQVNGTGCCRLFRVVKLHENAIITKFMSTDIAYWCYDAKYRQVFIYTHFFSISILFAIFDLLLHEIWLI